MRAMEMFGRRVLKSGLLCSAMLALASTAAHGYSVSIAPASQTVTLGTQVAVSVTVADLLPAGVGNYNFDISFNDAILAYSSVTDAFALGFALGVGVTGGVGTLSVSDFSLEDPTVLLLQQAAELARTPDLTLFTLYFDTIGLGTSVLSFTGSDISDVDGLNTKSFADIGHNDGSITVVEPNLVPVPGTVPLLLAGLMAGALARRRAD